MSSQSDLTVIRQELTCQFALGEITREEFEARRSAIDEVLQVPVSPPFDPQLTGGARPTLQRTAELVPGRLVDRFELVDFLGQGGMGQVWKAVDPRRKDDGHEGFVVLKFLPPEMRTNEEALTDFCTVYRRIQQLHHQHICPVYDLGECPEFGSFQVMRFIDGVSLSAWRRQHQDESGRLTVEQVVGLLKPVAAALDYAHGKGIVHRDIKPGNILVEDDGRDVQVIDFGLAAEVQSVMSQSSRARMSTGGTAAYMAPEQWAGRKQDGQTDQYALATLSYELLTGRSPFEAANEMALAYAVSNSPAEAGDGLAQHVNEALLKGLSKDRKERFNSCVELLAATSKPSETQKIVFRESSEETTEPALLSAPFSKEEARRSRQQWSVHLKQPEKLTLDLADGNGVEFVLIPPGEFDMGSPHSADELLKMLLPSNWNVSESIVELYAREQPLHAVRITRPMYVAKYAVTLDQFREFVAQTGYRTAAESELKRGGYHLDDEGKWVWNESLSWWNPGFEQDSRHPVLQISWHDAQAFISWLGKKSDRRVRLLTEAEWEYACRAGTTGLFQNGDNLEAVSQLGNTADASFKSQYARYPSIKSDDGYVHTAPVGMFLPNAFGLYDMLGNVSEWCGDWFSDDYYAASPMDDPSGPVSGSYRVLRGGSWFYCGIPNCRCADRGRQIPADRCCSIGFRVLCEV